MNLTPVRSSLLQAIGFDESTGELIIQFPRGATYAYSGESVRDHYTMLMSPDNESVGKYFLQNIKNKPEIPCRRLDQPAEKKPDDASPDPTADINPNAKSTQKRKAALQPPTPLKQLF
jgi:hypothetical protein